MGVKAAIVIESTNHGADDEVRLTADLDSTGTNPRYDGEVFETWALNTVQRLVTRLNRLVDRPLREGPTFHVVSDTRVQELLRASTFLSHLEAAGVDNWEGYSIAVQAAAGEDPEA